MTEPLEQWSTVQILRILQAQVDATAWELDDKVRRGRLQVLGNLATAFGVTLQAPPMVKLPDPFTIEVENESNDVRRGVL